jgi:cell division protein FtsQ
MKQHGWRNERRAQPGRALRRHAGRLRALFWLAALGLGVAAGATRGAEWLARALPERAGAVRLAVVGQRHTRPEELLAAAGVAPGTKLAALDLARVRESVRALPWVRSARVAALPPNRLIVAIEEREPVAIARLGGARWWVDRDGRAFAPAVAGAALPELVGALAPDDLRLADGVAWLSALQASGLGAPRRVVLADRDPAAAPALELAGGLRVLLGEGERERKLARLARLLAAEPPELATTAEIDLRFGADVILRPPAQEEVAKSSNASKGG